MFDPEGLLLELRRLHCVDHIVVAYSGGVDSSVLLHALAELRDQQQIAGLVAVHVNHGLSAGAGAWQSHCEAVCERLKVPLEVERVNVTTQSRGLEDAAREARYAALAKHLLADFNLLTAQHLDDQAETVLLRLMRGSGSRGLGAMRASRPIGAARLVRPLLAWSKADLLDFAQRCGLTWIEDHSNCDLDLDRNYLRHQVLPVLGQRWPGCAASLAHSASLARDADDALRERARAELLAVEADQGALPVNWLRDQGNAMQGVLLQEWARMLGLPVPGMRAVREVLEVVLEAGVDRMPETQWGRPEMRAQLRRYRAQLYLGALQAPCDAVSAIPWRPVASTRLPDGSRVIARRVRGAGIAASLLDSGQVELRFRRGGERCQPAGRPGSHPLRKILQELAVPPWERDRIPMIYLDNQMIALTGYFICEGCLAGPDDWGWTLSWQLPSIEAG